jgi:squalene-associated FAD-dependent desaturase
VIVIGAGFAGLSAAVAVAARGARVLVLEARPGLGGRASAFTDPETGELVDNGQHALFGCYHQTFRFLRTIGTDGLVRLHEQLEIEVIDSEGRRSRLRSAVLPPPMHLVGGLLSWDALSWRDRGAALLAAPALVRAAWRYAHGYAPDAQAQRETVSAWLRRHGQTPRLCALLWEPLAVAALNQQMDVAAAAPFVRVLAEMFGGSRRDAAIGLPRVPLDALYAKPAERWLVERGSAVRTGATAHVVCAGGAVSHVEVRGERIRSSAVVCAAPWHALERTIVGAPPSLAALIARASAMGSSPIVTVNLWLDRRVTDVPFVGLPGRTMQWVFDKRQAFGEVASHLCLVSSGAEDIVARSNRELVDLAVGEIRAALPPARAAQVLRAVVVREKRATFSLAPGQPPRPQTTTPVAGLFLAGDWIDTGLPATIESAVVSGYWAAKAIATANSIGSRPHRPGEFRRSSRS